jgi:Phosphotransferase enzyme family
MNLSTPARLRPLAATTLPDLDQYVDADGMQRLLASRLPGGFAEGALQLQSLRIDNVRRSTSRERNPCPLSLCYHLRVRDTATGREGLQTLFAQVLRGDAAADIAAQHPRRQMAKPAFGEPLIAWPDLHLLLWALPNDPGLPQLPQLLSDASLARRLQRLDLATADDSVHPQLVRHVPQDRASLRVALSNAGAGEHRMLYAKTFADDRAGSIHRQFQRAWQASQCDSSAPLVARPLAHDISLRCVWQAPAPGRPLADSLDTSIGPDAVTLASEALAWLHAGTLEAPAGAPAHTVAWWLKEVQRRCRKIERVDHRLALEAARIAKTLTNMADGVATRPLALIHGDCHPDQFWIHDGRAVLFDFDEFTLGDPMEDLASGLVRLAQPERSAALGEAWVRGYAARAPGRFDARSLAWHLTAQSLLQVTRAFIYQQPGWRAVFEQRLLVAQQRATLLARGVLS